MNKSITLCNNCGKHGHMFHQCKMPITSYGIIVFKPASDNGFQYLMIRRKDSFCYIDFLRGKYSPYTIEQIQNIIKRKLLAVKLTEDARECAVQHSLLMGILTITKWLVNT